MNPTENDIYLDLKEVILAHENRNAFFINGIYYTYLDFAKAISNIRFALKNNTGKIIGIITNDDLETYAAIVAIWFEGKAYVPINPDIPSDRNQNIISEAGIETIIDSSETAVFPNIKAIQSKKIEPVAIDLEPNKIPESELVYLLFTSGTTGKPKGVPISKQNLSGFTKAFWDLGYKINEDDRFLQMFELTFDLSVMSYLIPLLKGSCVYLVPKDKIKYSYIFELMEDYELTVALMVPSILHYLRPYFDEIDLPKMRYSLFCGEALPLDVTTEWSNCLPNAQITNVYGPTEDTIFCTFYDYVRNGQNKSYNGILSIGKSMNYNSTIIIDEENNVLEPGNVGQLCLGGIQLTPGYWKNPEKNKEAFFNILYNNKEERFYKTGDLCKADENGDLLYIGRIDFQTKIQGFRVELSEIEFYAKEFLSKINVVVLTLPDDVGNTEVAMVIESKPFDYKDTIDYMKEKLPYYMIPKKVKFIDTFPLNVNGKTDRKKLEILFID
ncbi:AMP-binding protein [Flavobacterium wongokense]|uniref:AMP-binding protein n=1 Tax=Flavobacterium wongokense TaxID=2910674 RepID=UPI001F164AAF|nr:AMP-binding protein [Flavobacterium sp. WG47]MCF6132537.1 AMP-binding protein [Flavobacterium sp. WG47]